MIVQSNGKEHLHQEDDNNNSNETRTNMHWTHAQTEIVMQGVKN